MVTVLLAISGGFFSLSSSLSPFTLITIPLGAIFFSAAVGAAFGRPERGAKIGVGVLAAFLGILAVTGNEAIALAITVAVAAGVCALLFWRRTTMLRS